MATLYIRAVHLERAPGASHDHIAAVKVVGSERSIPRSEVEEAIRNGRNVYFTNASPPARVIVRNCPFCMARDYITTEPDYTVKNNLLDLEKY